MSTLDDRSDCSYSRLRGVRWSISCCFLSVCSKAARKIPSSDPQDYRFLCSKLCRKDAPPRCIWDCLWLEIRLDRSLSHCHISCYMKRARNVSSSFAAYRGSLMCRNFYALGRLPCSSFSYIWDSNR